MIEITDEMVHRMACWLIAEEEDSEGLTAPPEDAYPLARHALSVALTGSRLGLTMPFDERLKFLLTHDYVRPE